MLIPLIEKDTSKNDFTCRDGEVEINVADLRGDADGTQDSADKRVSEAARTAETAREIRFSLEAALPYPTATVRVALQSGDGHKCSLMLSGEASRVDAASSERITQAVVAKAAAAFADILADTRAAGLFMLPFRAFCSLTAPDGSLTFPSAQTLLLPCDFPPHPEITAVNTDDDGTTLSLRIPVRPHRLLTLAPPGLTEGMGMRTYVSRSLWVPDPKEISGSIGSVRSADGGTAIGVRFSFMSESRLKGSVVAPDKYYRYIGNDTAGHHVTNQSVANPDYDSYAKVYGRVAPFPADALRETGSGIDPLSWIADWRGTGNGYLPIDTEYECETTIETATANLDMALSSLIAEMKAMTGYGNWLLTRPMTFARDSMSRHNAEATAPKCLRVYGLSRKAETFGVLLGSTDGTAYEPVVTFSPMNEAAVLAPARPFWRLLLGSSKPLAALCLEVSGL